MRDRVLPFPPLVRHSLRDAFQLVWLCVYVVAYDTGAEKAPAEGLKHEMNLRDFLGGHPLAVFIRLALISIIAGVVLSVFGITPRNFFQSLDSFARYVYDLGFGAVEWLLQYMVLGAMIVVPVWLIARLLRTDRTRAD